MSCTINPWFWALGYDELNKNHRIIMMTISVPSNTGAYYMNIPYNGAHDGVLKKYMGHLKYSYQEIVFLK